MDDNSWAVYMVECSDGTIYTGATNDVTRRIYEHNNVDSKASKYVMCRRPATPIHVEDGFPDRSSAQRREYEIKQLTYSQKKYIANDR